MKNSFILSLLGIVAEKAKRIEKRELKKEQIQDRLLNMSLFKLARTPKQFNVLKTLVIQDLFRAGFQENGKEKAAF